MCMSRLSSLCGDITRALDYNPGPPFATRRDATAPSPQDFEVWAPDLAPLARPASL
ncbi:hypothetical protein BC826DRAFT_1058933 [Russula brevipes]|nr:hypothetical protein BC826DRAFT_1058933 [Russula brevipes]